MPSTDVRFRVNRPRVIAQTIDGEVVAIHLETGNYYSLLDSGATAWALLEGSSDAASLAERLAEHYDASTTEIAESLTPFLEVLQTEGLIVPDEGADLAPTNGSSGAAGLLEIPDERGSFKAPAIEKFDDMQDLILLDPVHEVTEEAGWPHRA